MSPWQLQAQLPYNGGIPHLAVTLCAESEAYICSDRRGPPWGRKVFSIAEDMVALSYLTETMHVCTYTNVCIKTCIQVRVVKASILYMCCINLAVLMLQFVLWMQWNTSIL